MTVAHWDPRLHTDPEIAGLVTRLNELAEDIRREITPTTSFFIVNRARVADLERRRARLRDELAELRATYVRLTA